MYFVRWFELTIFDLKYEIWKMDGETYIFPIIFLFLLCLESFFKEIRMKMFDPIENNDLLRLQYLERI